MNKNLNTFIEGLDLNSIPAARKDILQQLIDLIQANVDKNERVNINCICTHNSRRSHLTQVWAKVASMYYRVRKVNAYSGGTEETSVFPVIIQTLEKQGIDVIKLSESDNPVYAYKYDDLAPPIIGFSKKYSDKFNPQSGFIALMTCGDANDKCPIVEGAKSRVVLTYRDPKISDGTDTQTATYIERSREIATEMFYVFSRVEK